MNFYDYALMDRPTSLYKMNAAGTGLVDIARAGGNTTSNSKWTTSIVSGNPKSPTVGLGSTAVLAFDEVNFVATSALKEFTLGCLFKPLIITTEMSILSHYTGSPMDGLIIDADKISFRVKFNAGSIIASWEYPDVTEAYTIHGVYTGGDAKLFINGELKATAEVPDNYVASGLSTVSDGQLYSGMTSSANDKAIIDAPAGYPYALSAEQIERQTKAAVDVVPMVKNVMFLGGALMDGTERRIADQQVRNDAATWSSVDELNVGYTSGDLIPTVSQDAATLGQSNAGYWTGLFVIDNPDVSTIAGIKAEWNGNGVFTVQSSLDGGSTYQTVTNGNLILTSQGLNPAGKNLLIKISFPGGIVNDPAEVRDLTLTVYEDNTIYGYDFSRPVTVVGDVSTALYRNEPIETNSQPGMHFNGGNGYINIGPDVSGSPSNVAAIEFWVRSDGVSTGAGGYIFDARNGGGTAYLWIPEASTTWGFAGHTAVYVNGVSVANGTAMKKGEWNHVLFVFATPLNTIINVGPGNFIGDMNLISTYPTAPTAAQALALYNNYGSVPILSITEVGTVTMFEPATPYVFTMADWANLPQQ